MTKTTLACIGIALAMLVGQPTEAAVIVTCDSSLGSCITDPTAKPMSWFLSEINENFTKIVLTVNHAFAQNVTGNYDVLEEDFIADFISDRLTVSNTGGNGQIVLESTDFLILEIPALGDRILGREVEGIGLIASVDLPLVASGGARLLVTVGSGAVQERTFFGSTGTYSDGINLQVVPEPASLTLLGSALLGLSWAMRHRKRT